ncbi:MAG: ring-cleaving dioxygenase [Gemmatimonadetes bacterium]|nr:ring-cleaving dioxygenase [Gemmatimonadota bacterium]
MVAEHANDIGGIHHVTAIAGDPQGNVDFYAGVLGLRLVKRTVNFDDAGAYHLYYGDELGRPGTILTFFAWPGAPRGRRGVGQVTATSFSVPEGALGYWAKRLEEAGVERDAPVRRLDHEALIFPDPDGLPLELVAHAGAEAREPWRKASVPEAHAIRGLYGVTLAEPGYEATAAMLTRAMGFRAAGEEGQHFRFEVGSGGAGGRLDILCVPDAAPGRVAVGTVHHVAWRVPGAAEQRAWRRRLERHGLDVTPVLDRKYFQSIYFREPGGVLFELATDPPGFTVDELPERLGMGLMLPAWLEPYRNRIEAALPALGPPVVGHA